MSDESDKENIKQKEDTESVEKKKDTESPEKKVDTESPEKKEDNKSPHEDEDPQEDEEVTEDDVPETEKHIHKRRHARKNHAKPKQSVGMWQFLTVLFAGLFVISIFTTAFDFVNPGEVTADNTVSNTNLLDQIKSEAKSFDAGPEEKNAIEDDIKTLSDLIEMSNEDRAASQKDIDNLASEIRAAIKGNTNPDSKPSTEPSTESSKPTKKPTNPTGEKATLDFYVMSQCPFGTQVENAVYPVLDSLGENVDFNLYFIASDNQDGTFQSLHGENEVSGDLVQACAIKYEPESFMDLIFCMNKDAQSIPDNWETCSEDLGLDTTAIKECYEGDEGKELLKKSIEATNTVGATGSPTIYLNGNRYSGGRSEMDFTRAICDALDNGPAACQDLPEAVTVNIISLNDERCGADCDVSKLISQLKSIFPGLEVTELDYNSEKGKALFTSTGVKLLPAILFDDTVKEGEGYQNVLPYLVEAGKYSSLRIGAMFDPTKEICDNGIDDTGNGDIDCDDSDCTDSLVCREEIKNNLQVFIMSDCPYGKLAVEALDGVITNFEGDLDYDIHYIASETADGFDSLHGQYEVEEDITQLCVKEHSPDAWFDYVLCRSKNGVKGNDWKTCAEETGVDVDAVQSCIDEGEGADLLKEDIKIAQSLGVGASPTWFANNKVQFSGIDAETVKSSFCQSNPDKKGCENILSSDTGGVPEGSC